MITVHIQQNARDRDMVDVYNRQPGRSGPLTSVWASVHVDMFHDSHAIYERLIAGEEIAVNITLAPEEEDDEQT